MRAREWRRSCCVRRCSNHSWRNETVPGVDSWHVCYGARRTRRTLDSGVPDGNSNGRGAIMPGVTQRVGVTRMVQDVPSKISYHPPLAWPGLTQRVTIIVTYRSLRVLHLLGSPMQIAAIDRGNVRPPNDARVHVPFSSEKKNSIKPAFSTRPDNTSSPFPSTRAGYVTTPFIEHSSS
jgi:hypothetical protein